MERTAKSNYRRAASRSTSRSQVKGKSQPESGFMETLVMQCIISGVILLLLLVICTVKTEFTDNIRSNLKMAISGQTSLEEIKMAPDAIKALFAENQEVPDEETQVTDVFLPVNETDMPTQTEETSAVGDFRIDEDILNEINTKVDPYGESAKN